MNTLSIRACYRPIRIGWCMHAGDFVALREAMKLTFTMWGGHYNPIIPIDDFEAASLLVKRFRVDFLYPVFDTPDITKFINRFPHLSRPFYSDTLFTEDGHGGHIPQILDIYHPIHRFHDEYFKNNSSPEFSVSIVKWQEEDPLKDVLLATYGSVPSVEITGTDYLDLIKKMMSAKTITLTPTDSLPLRTKNDWRVSHFSRSYIRQHYSVQNFWAHHGIYVGDSNDFEDLVAFWNLKATNILLMFYDPAQSTRFEPSLTKWLDILRSRPEGRFKSDHSVAIWSRERNQNLDTKIFGEELTVCTIDNLIWNGLNVKVPYMYFSQESVLSTIEEGSSSLPKLSFQLPAKPFGEEPLLFDQHFVVSINSGIGLYGSERATLFTPYLPELNEYYGRQYYHHWNKARVEPEGMGIICSANDAVLSINALDVVDLVKQVFLTAGIDAQPSKPGLITSRLIQQMGGLQGCRVFKVGGARMLLKKYGPDTSFSRKSALQKIDSGDPENDIPPIIEHKDLFIESRPLDTELTSQDVFSYLLKKRVFRTGLEFDCPSCQLRFWRSLDDMRIEIECEYCGHKFNASPYLPDNNVWKYRRSGLFGREDNQEGAIPVILTIQQLDTAFSTREMLYAPAMLLNSDSISISKCETDFVILTKNFLDGKIDVAIGECKTRMETSSDDVKNLREIADAFPRERFNVYIIFSKLNSFSPEELKRVRQLNSKHHHRVILFTTRELEPYFIYERTAKEFNIKSHGLSFEEMALVTEEVFFNQTQKQNSS